VPELTVTLIHGTFARGALWTKEGSPLWTDLQKRFKCSALIDSFDWSGDNTVFARRTAGDELAAQLDELKQRFPSAKQYLVAHSHGGNVALYAAERTLIHGIACLATPFLHASPRDPSLIGISPIQRGLFGIACLFMYIASFVWNFGCLDGYIGLYCYYLVLYSVILWRL
jgi:pimeloyl-ACP methyl ester carboxylesterase